MPESSEPTLRNKLRITARALLDTCRLGDPKLHPDGERIVFVSTEADFDESRWVSHLWLAWWPVAPEADDAKEPNAVSPKSDEAVGRSKAPVALGDGAESPDTAPDEDDAPRQLTFSRDGESRPRWSPSGATLAFLSTREDETQPLDDDEDEDPREQIWVLPIDGGEARRVTNAKEGVIDYYWLPDSGTLVYLCPEARPKPIEQVRRDERGRKRIDPVIENEDRLRCQFWSVDIDEMRPKLLLTADYGVSEFALSPDGKRLVYATNYTGEWNDYHIADLWLLDIEAGTRRRLTARPGGKQCLRWSPDGETVAYISWLDPELSYSRQQIFTIDADEDASADPISLTEDHIDEDVEQIEWSKHDGAIYAVTAYRTGSALYRITLSPAGATIESLERSPDREIADIDLDVESDAVVFVGADPGALEEIYVRDENGATRPATDVNASFSTAFEIPRQEVISWTSEDGLPIEGVVTYPKGWEAGKPSPVVVQLHGGPKGRATNGLRDYGMAPVWAAEGYMAFRPNFRGSEGYGNAFAIANRRDLGQGDFADVMSGVDHLVANGLADPERLAVMGGSYGGYLTNWAIGHTDRFRAAISMFGIFHLQTDYSNSELSRWDREYLGAYYWEDPEIYRLLSPGSYVDQIKTPTLVIHGDDDSNTFISNSKELYQALRHRGVTARFVHYPREGHGLREPNHRIDEVRQSLAWIDRFVRGDGTAPDRYRPGDRVRSLDGAWELVVTSVDAPPILGAGPDYERRSGGAPPIWSLLEVVITLRRLTESAEGPYLLPLNAIRLTPLSIGEGATRQTESEPVGVPVAVPGGKILVTGAGFSATFHPDGETRDFAGAFAALFRIPTAGGDWLLTVTSFPPVEIGWRNTDADGSADAKSGEREGASTGRDAPPGKKNQKDP